MTGNTNLEVVQDGITAVSGRTTSTREDRMVSCASVKRCVIAVNCGDSRQQGIRIRKARDMRWRYLLKGSLHLIKSSRNFVLYEPLSPKASNMMGLDVSPGGTSPRRSKCRSRHAVSTKGVSGNEGTRSSPNLTPAPGIGRLALHGPKRCRTCSLPNHLGS